LHIPATWAQFENWIAEDLAVEHTVDVLLRSTGIQARELDRFSSLAALALLPPCGGFSSTASVRIEFEAETSLPR